MQVIVVTADRLIYGLSRHWLLLFNLLAGIYAGLPVLSPLLEAKGPAGLGSAIFRMYASACHQLPYRSFFIFGKQMAYCQRDTFLYGSIFVAGLAFSLVRKRLTPPRLRIYFAILLPMVIDGTGQLFGLWESTWWSRVLTGTLAGTGTVWLVYPYFERGFTQVRGALEDKFRRAGVSLGLFATTRRGSVIDG